MLNLIRWTSVFAAIVAIPAILVAVAVNASAEAKNDATQAETPKKTYPLDAEIERGRARLVDMKRDIQDYSCVFTKRERVDGKLLPYEQMYMKVRHEPFSVWMYFFNPKDKEGQQAVWIEGRNNGKMIAQPAKGSLLHHLGPFKLDPKGSKAMEGNRYPITATGFVKMTEQLIAEGEAERKRDINDPQCEVKYFKNAKVADRICTVTQIKHPKLAKFDYGMARIFVDDEWNIPIRFESYLWPEKPGGEYQPLEEYTYTNLKFNNSFTDADFVIRKEKKKK